MKLPIRLSVCVGCLSAFCLAHAGGVIQGEVKTVIDGDRIVVQFPIEAGPRTVRLAGIDAPDIGQAYADSARSNLVQILKGKRTSFELVGLDVNQTVVAILDVEGRNPALLLATSGLAWTNWSDSTYLTEKDLETIDKAVYNAQTSRIGLWKNKKAVSPWEFRAAQRKKIERRMKFVKPKQKKQKNKDLPT